MFVPLHDTNPLKSIRHQYVTFTLIVLNVGVYLIYQSGLVLPANEYTGIAYAVVPAELFSTSPWIGDASLGPPGQVAIPERLTLVTYMFLHAGWLHITDQTVNDDVVNPFGGIGASGNGTSIGGPANWELFTDWQWVTIKSAPPAYPF